MTTPDFAMPLADLAQALSERTLRATDLAEQALSAMSLDAYRTTDPAPTRAMARLADEAFDLGVRTGALQGVPVSIKDLYGVPGWPTFAGTPNRLPDRFESPGPLVQALIEQLAVVTGKTHTVEFAFGGIGTNPHAGTPINPFDAAEVRVPGGSSAGAGVSLQEGSAWLALGTDTAGSVRIPAAWTGTVGLKTTAGRWSTEGIVPLSTTLDTAGLLARTVADVAFAFEALDPHSAPLPPVVDLGRVAVGRAPAALWEGASPGVIEAVEAALAELPGPASPAAGLPIDEALELFSVGGPVAAELDGFLAHEVPEWRATLDPNVAARVAVAGELPVREYLRRRQRLLGLAELARAVFTEVDVVVSPTVVNTPPRVADLTDPDAYRTQNLLALRNTSVVNYLGLCALTLPCGLDAAGMPVGLQLVGPPHAETRLLGIGLAIERILGPSRERLGIPPRLAQS
ncbi:MAG: amidase [Myxococcota bacterium]